MFEILFYPFTPPLVSPDTMKRWRMSMTITTGSEMMMLMAANWLQGLKVSYCPTIP
ncbi:hypothetical protein D3C87_2191320 [compost metagenome]